MAFTRFTKNVLNVSALPDRVQNQAQTLKATFDQAGVDIKTALNALIVELEASTSADNIGADVQSVATKTVQAILTAFEEAIADRYTKTEAETLLAIETNNLLADLDINLTTGVITTTKKDGTKTTIDTAIEKVPSKFEFIESGDTYLFKITNVDGSTTQADVTKLMNIYNFNNSDYITFEVTGEGTQKTVTANIKANSIGLDKLSLSVVSTLEGYMSSARDSATAAKTSETNARASELNALEAKNTAVNKAAEATASASAAKTSETNAEYWAKQAQAGGGGGGGITEIPIATADTLGGIKVGQGLEITEDGILSTLASRGEITTLYSGTANTQGTLYSLSDSVKNYDLILVMGGATDGTVATTTIMINPEDINVNHQFMISNLSSTQYFFKTMFIFPDDISFQPTLSNTTGWGTPAITKVYGIKLGNKVLDGQVNVDDTPIEGSENVVTSGGVKEYVDKHGVRVLEASTDNVIDFNTLTEPGVYLIKNCSDTIGTTLNSPITGTYTFDVALEVVPSVANGSEPYFIYQNARYGSDKFGSRYYYSASSPTSWTSWKLNEFGGQVRANTNNVATLSASQVRNISAQTTDLTAGTSTLATGDIVFVYE